MLATKCIADTLQGNEIWVLCQLRSSLTGKNGKPFTCATFVKRCSLAATEQLSRENYFFFFSVNGDGDGHVRTNLHENQKGKAAMRLSFIASADNVSDAARILILIRGLDRRFYLHAELASFLSLCVATGEYLIMQVKKTFSLLGLKWGTSKRIKKRFVVVKVVAVLCSCSTL